MEDYIALKLCSNLGFGFSNLKVYLKNSCNEVVFEGVTDSFGFVKLPICDGKVYKLVINMDSFKNKKHLVTLLLVDKNYPNIKIERGKIILWQDIQYK